MLSELAPDPLLSEFRLLLLLRNGSGLNQALVVELGKSTMSLLSLLLHGLSIHVLLLGPWTQPHITDLVSLHPRDSVGLLL